MKCTKANSRLEHLYSFWWNLRWLRKTSWPWNEQMFKSFCLYWSSSCLRSAVSFEVLFGCTVDNHGCWKHRKLWKVCNPVKTIFDNMISTFDKNWLKIYQTCDLHLPFRSVHKICCGYINKNWFDNFLLFSQLRVENIFKNGLHLNTYT